MDRNTLSGTRSISGIRELRVISQYNVKNGSIIKWKKKPPSTKPAFQLYNCGSQIYLSDVFAHTIRSFSRSRTATSFSYLNPADTAWHDSHESQTKVRRERSEARMNSTHGSSSIFVATACEASRRKRNRNKRRIDREREGGERKMEAQYLPRSNLSH